MTVERFSRALSLDHVSTSDTSEVQGGLYFEQAPWAQAELLWKQVIMGRERALGLGHRNTVSARLPQIVITNAKSPTFSVVLICIRCALFTDIRREQGLVVFNLGLVHRKQLKLDDLVTLIRLSWEVTVS